MLDKLKERAKLIKDQSDLKKELEKIFIQHEKGTSSILIRGDKKVEKIIINGVEDKALKDLINDAIKELDKKVEKKMRAHIQSLGLGGL